MKPQVISSKYPKNLIKDPYKDIDFKSVEETDPAELTGSVVRGQLSTRELWNTWKTNKKTDMPKLSVPDGAKLHKNFSFKA